MLRALASGYAGPVRFRSGGWEGTVGAAVTVVFALGAVVAVVVMWTGNSALPPARADPIRAGGTAFVLLVSGYGLAAHIRMGVEILASSVVIRGFGWPTRVPVADVVRFRFDERVSKAVAELSDGRTLVCVGVQQGNGIVRKRRPGPAEVLIGPMNEALCAAQTASAAAGFVA